MLDVTVGDIQGLALDMAVRALALGVVVAAGGLASVTAAAGTPVVVLDPGHDALPNLATEPIGPGSATLKIKDGGGTRGVVTHIPEPVLVLRVALLTRPLLERAGLRVVLTRTTIEGRSMGNIARARIANRAGAALFLRIHADGSQSAAVRGTHTMFPALRHGWTDDIHSSSARAARIVQRELVAALRFPDRGVWARSDFTGLNWADVPAILVELGFMTNPREDRPLATDRIRRAAARGLCRGILRFLGRDAATCAR